MSTDNKARRSVLKTPVGAAILLPLSVLIQVRFISQGEISFLWVAITAISAYFLWHGHQMRRAAKARAEQPAATQSGGAPGQFSWSQSTRQGQREPALTASAIHPQAATASAPAPGWYTDPSGTSALRWWDGSTWTPHVR